MHVHHLIRGPLRDRRGNMLMIFAFAILPITFATGMGIDYAGAMRLQTRVSAIADAASLASVTSPMMKSTMDKACAASRATFESQIAGMKGLTLNTANAAALTITITDTFQSGNPETVTCPATGTPTVTAKLPLSRTAVVTFAGQSANNFAGVLGRASLGISGTASAKTIVAPFIDVYVALDTSQSMGLAATPTDELRLWNATLKLNGRGCQFGCHARDPNEKYAMEDIARMINPADGKPYARMRVDVLRDATMDMIDTAMDNQGQDQIYRFGLYRIGENFTAAANVIYPLSKDLVTAKAKVSALTLGPNRGDVGYGDTNLTAMLDNLKPMMDPSASGDGTLPTKPRAFLFIVTDGVQDLCWSSHCTSVIDYARCQQYKDAGITVGIVYTTYLPVKDDPTKPNSTKMRHEYDWLIAPLPPSTISPALQKCASPGWFFEASDASTIHAAMQNLFHQATQTPAIIR